MNRDKILKAIGKLIRKKAKHEIEMHKVSVELNRLWSLLDENDDSGRAPDLLRKYHIRS